MRGSPYGRVCGPNHESGLPARLLFFRLAVVICRRTGRAAGHIPARDTGRSGVANPAWFTISAMGSIAPRVNPWCPSAVPRPRSAACPPIFSRPFISPVSRDMRRTQICRTVSSFGSKLQLRQEPDGLFRAVPTPRCFRRRHTHARDPSGAQPARPTGGRPRGNGYCDPYLFLLTCM